MVGIPFAIGAMWPVLIDSRGMYAFTCYFVQFGFLS